MSVIACIPADRDGNKLFIKELRKDGVRLLLKYRSTYNDIPFVETEVFHEDHGKSIVISGDDGTILWRFSVKWLDKLS